MAIVEHQSIFELVDAADFAVRAASQLRLAKKGRSPSDLGAIECAIRFLESAKIGGEFMAGQRSAQFSGALKPLNWVADTYISVSPGESENIKYDAIASYLNQIIESLRGIQRGVSVEKLENFCESLRFFEVLAKLLSDRVDHDLRHEPSILESVAFAKLDGS